MIKEKNMYKPLPESLTIKTSGVHGLGLFADQKIKQATNLGMSHMKMKDTIFRTPLGGFLNHSDDPNCCKAELLMRDDSFDYKKWNLVTLEDIKEGEELTLTYTFYKI